jgi:hypothetical protein
LTTRLLPRLTVAPDVCSTVHDALIRAAPDMLPPLEQPRLSASEPRAGAGGDEKEETAIHDSSDPDVVAVDNGDNDAVPIEDGNSDVVVVDYDEMDAENPLTWSPTRKWLLVLAISWMGFVR